MLGTLLTSEAFGGGVADPAAGVCVLAFGGDVAVCGVEFAAEAGVVY